MAVLLEAKNLTSVRGERTLFHSLNLQIQPGEAWQIQGANGAGKSTLLRILVGLLAPQTGEVLHQGEKIQDNRAAYHQNLLFIGHKAGIKPELTALENLSFYATLQGQHLTEPPYDILAKIGLVGLEDIPAQRLSAGQQRRIALARLWLSQATIWVLDEPFTSLDVEGVALLEVMFKKHLASGGAVILTSHQPLKHLQNVQVLNLEYQH